jgi:hypothetical protein
VSCRHLGHAELARAVGGTLFRMLGLDVRLKVARVEDVASSRTISVSLGSFYSGWIGHGIMVDWERCMDPEHESWWMPLMKDVCAS